MYALAMACFVSTSPKHEESVLLMVENRSYDTQLSGGHAGRVAKCVTSLVMPPVLRGCAAAFVQGRACRSIEATIHDWTRIISNGA